MRMHILGIGLFPALSQGMAVNPGPSPPWIHYKIFVRTTKDLGAHFSWF